MRRNRRIRAKLPFRPVSPEQRELYDKERSHKPCSGVKNTFVPVKVFSTT